MTKYLLTLYCLLIGPMVRAADINWRPDYAAARKEAKETGKPLLVYFTMDNCPPCVKMQPTLHHLAAKINLDFVPYQHVVLPGRPNDLAARANVPLAPTVVIANAAGGVLHKLEGPQDAVKLGTLLASVPRQPPAGEDNTKRVVAGGPCPAKCPCAECWCSHTGQSCAATGKPCMPMGLDASKLSKEDEVCWFGATPFKATEFHGDTVPDLSKLGFVTVASKDAAKGQMVAEAIRNSAVGERFRVNACDPEHPTMKGFKLSEDKEFQRTGFKVIVQAAPLTPGGFGKELDAFYDWPGVDGFTERFNRVDPAYDPNRQPNKPAVKDYGTVLAYGLLAVAFVVGLALAALLLPNQTQPQPQPESNYELAA